MVQKHKYKKESSGLYLNAKTRAGGKVLSSTNLTLNPQVITNWTFSDEPLPEFKRLMAILLRMK